MTVVHKSMRRKKIFFNAFATRIIVLTCICQRNFMYTCKTFVSHLSYFELEAHPSTFLSPGLLCLVLSHKTFVFSKVLHSLRNCVCGIKFTSGSISLTSSVRLQNILQECKSFSEEQLFFYNYSIKIISILKSIKILF